MQLKKEKADEIVKRDFCVDEKNKNALDNQKKTSEKSDTEAKIQDQELTIKGLSEEIAKLKKGVAENQAQLKNAAEERAQQNKDYQSTVADQRATQKLLTAALNVLKGFYDKKSLLEVDQAPEGFKSHKPNKGATGVMGLIETIKNDAKTMEAEAIRTEAAQKKAYEDVVKKTNSETV